MLDWNIVVLGSTQRYRQGGELLLEFSQLRCTGYFTIMVMRLTAMLAVVTRLSRFATLLLLHRQYQGRGDADPFFTIEPPATRAEFCPREHYTLRGLD